MSRIPIALSVAFQTNLQPAEYVALAKLVDGFNFHTVSVYNDLLFQPALGPLLMMAPHLKRARLGPATLNPYTVHPVELAGQVALLDMATAGRAYLGLARGAWLSALDRPQRRPVQTLREATQLVQHLLRRDAAAFDGEIFKLAAGAVLQYQPLRPRVPIMIGTWGLATARMAGELADEVKIGGSASPSMARHLRPAIDQGSLSAGRARGSVGICLGAVTVVDKDRARARAVARQRVAMYLPVVAALDPEVADREWLAKLADMDRRREFDAIARTISDEMLDRFAFSGTPRDILAQVEAAADAGAARVELGTPLGVDGAATAIKLLGEQVLPELEQP